MSRRPGCEVRESSTSGVRLSAVARTAKEGRGVAISLALTLILLGGLSGCRGCGMGRAPVDPATALPGDAAVAAVVPRLDAALAQTRFLYDRFLADFPDLSRLVEDVRREVGFNILVPESLEEIGVDPAGGAGMAVTATEVLGVLPVVDAGRLEEHLQRKLRPTLGEGAEFREVAVGPARGTGGFRRGANQPEVVWVRDRGALVLAASFRPGGSPLAGLARVLALPETARLARNPGFVRVRQTLAEGSAVLAFADARGIPAALGLTGSLLGGRDVPWLADVTRTTEAVGLGLSITRGRVSARFRVLLTEEGEKAVRESLPLAGNPLDLGRVVDADALLLLKFGFRPDRLLPSVRSHLGGTEREEFEKGLEALRQVPGLDVERDVLPLLTGRVAFALYGMDLGGSLQGLLGNPSPAVTGQEDPSSFFTGTYLQVRDPTRLAATLGVLAGILQARGTATVTVEAGPGGLKVWRAARAGKVLAAWTIKDDLLVLTTGRDRMARTLESLTGKVEGLKAAVKDPSARRLLSPDDGAGLLVSVPNLLRAFPVLHLVPELSRSLSSIGEVLLVTDPALPGSREVPGELAVGLTGGE